MEPEGSLPYSQMPATCPYPELTPSSPHDPLQLNNFSQQQQIVSLWCTSYTFRPQHSQLQGGLQLSSKVICRGRNM
jgi:hypothetical protein